MNKTAEQARQLVLEMLPELQKIHGVECVICPPFTTLMAVSTMLQATNVELGAQDIFWEESGAYTGEISAEMIKEFCHYVIIGHSERRTYFGETDESVNKKVRAALTKGLIPILCVGETLQENEDNLTQEIITWQLRQGLSGVEIKNARQIVIAYEPVWAIGTGRPSTGAGANLVAGVIIRPILQELFGKDVAYGIRVLYGGSVNGKNAPEFFIQPDIDGALVGGASLKMADFIGIVDAAAARI